MQTQLLVEENTRSCYSSTPWFAARDAARRNQINSAQLTDEQRIAINELYKLVCAAYNCRVFKNVRKTCATIKAEHVHLEASLDAYNRLHTYCINNSIGIRRNVNTESISYVLMF